MTMHITPKLPEQLPKGNYIPVAQFEGEISSIAALLKILEIEYIEPGLGVSKSIYFTTSHGYFGFVEQLPESPTPNSVAMYLGGAIQFDAKLIDNIISSMGCHPSTVSWLSNNVVI